MELKYHKIQKIQNKRVRNRYPRLYGKNARLPEHAYGHDVGIVLLETDQGATGWGRGHCNSDLKEYLIGKDVSHIFSAELGVIDDKALPIDVALHDLAGNILGLPVFKMMNTQAAKSVNCYDGAIYMNDISPDSKPGGLNAVIEDCRYDYDLGYRDFKVKIGRGNMWMSHEDGFNRDIEVIQAIRRAFPESNILVDANDGYNLDTTLKFIDATLDCGIYWIEEPFIENIDDLKKLREYLEKKSPKTLIADGESNWDIPLLKELAKQGVIDVLLMDVCDYGFTKWRRFMLEIMDLKVMASPHCWGEKLKTHYAAHMAAAFSDMIPTIEGVPDETEGINFEKYILTDGKILVPEASGFGMEFIWGRDNG